MLKNAWNIYFDHQGKKTLLLKDRKFEKARIDHDMKVTKNNLENWFKKILHLSFLFLETIITFNRLILCIVLQLGPQLELCM